MTSANSEKKASWRKENLRISGIPRGGGGYRKGEDIL